MRACGCVHERGPGATHTHTHTLTRPRPRRTLGCAARALGPSPQARSSRVPRPVLSPSSLSLTMASHERRGQDWGPGHSRPARCPPPRCAAPARRGRGWNGDSALGVLTAQAAECARERPAGPAPPRRQGRRGRGRRAGRQGHPRRTGPVAPPRGRPEGSPAPRAPRPSLRALPGSRAPPPPRLGPQLSCRPFPPGALLSQLGVRGEPEGASQPGRVSGFSRSLPFLRKRPETRAVSPGGSRPSSAGVCDPQTALDSVRLPCLQECNLM